MTNAKDTVTSGDHKRHSIVTEVGSRIVRGKHESHRGNSLLGNSFKQYIRVRYIESRLLLNVVAILDLRSVIFRLRMFMYLQEIFKYIYIKCSMLTGSKIWIFFLNEYYYFIRKIFTSSSEKKLTILNDGALKILNIFAIKNFSLFFVRVI